MFFIVKIRNSEKYLVLKRDWIQNIDMDLITNYGLLNKSNKRKVYKIYYSLYEEREPNFQLNHDIEFVDDESPHCYIAKILYGFRKYIFLYYCIKTNVIYI